MRQLIYTTLAAAVPVTSVVGNNGQNIFTPNMLGIDPVPARPDTPFLLIVEQPSNPAMEVRKTSRSVTQTFDIRCYDTRGSYDRTDSLLRTVRDTLLEIPLPAVSPSGARCIDIRWLGTGTDSDDPDLDFIFKFTTMRFVTNI